MRGLTFERMTTFPSKLPLITLDDSVLLPGAVASLDADERGAQLARELLATKDKLVAIVLSGRELGVVARVETVTPDGTVIVSVLERARIRALEQGQAEVEHVEVPKASGTELEALALEARRLAREILSMIQGIPASVVASLETVQDPSALADLLAHRVPAEPEEKQKVLETLEPVARLQLVVSMLARRREQLDVAVTIEGAVQEEMTRTQREHLLRKRMEAIRHELDEGEEAADPLEELEKKLASAGMPAEVKTQVDKELARLKKLPEASQERSVSRTWLQALADLPWSEATVDNLDIANARAVLDEDHHGLEKVKRRITQFLAVQKLRGGLRGPLLAFAGPPGVGKTSLGRSIARALGRKLVRVSLGGVRDEAEIRGHRRTYVGAMPGRIAQAMKRAGTVNPVVILDEVDKLGAGVMGDPSAALLEVLDPEQNHAFVDHFLEVPIDLSKVLFIATANSLETIPAPLLDRMELLEIPSYTLAEKVAIARTHLVPKQLEANGITGTQVSLADAALERIAAAHTREAGVRSLERRIGDVVRSLAVAKAAGTLVEPRIVEAAEIEEILGPDQFLPDLRETSDEPGVATGLAWTPVGGVVLTIETLRMPGHGKLILSGQLGEVMRESASAALSYARSHAADLGLRVLENEDLHVHIPAGAVPKDGPSAGVTMFTAIVSQLTGIPVRNDTAMTGEVTLRGKVLPVGGIKEKVLAAHRAGLRRIILPRQCAPDLGEIPQAVRDDLDVVLVSRMDEVLDAALSRPQPARVAA